MAVCLETQNRHLEAEHEARLHHLRGQAREVHIRRLGLRLRVGFQIFLVLVATLLGIGALVMIRDAINDQLRSQSQLAVSSSKRFRCRPISPGTG